MFQLSPLLADFIGSEKCQQTLTPTFNQSCSVFENCFRKRCTISKIRSSAILIPKKLHLKFVRMKRLNRNNEARNLVKNISDESFTVQQKYFSNQYGIDEKTCRENLVVEVKIFCNVCILFYVLQSKKTSLWVENGTILSHAPDPP